MAAAAHRLATFVDAPRLFEVRRRSILELAPSGMPIEDAEAWAKKLTRTGMERKLREFEIWIAERDDVIARKLGWQFDIMATSFFLSRRALKPAAHSGMPRWQDHLFIALSRSSNDATDYFQIPTGRVVKADHDLGA